MKKIFIYFLLLTLLNCSFDNKTGIWNNETKVTKKEDRFKKFEALIIEKKTFNEVIPSAQNLKILFEPIRTVSKWTDVNYNNNNNLENFNYEGLNQIVFKSKKISRNIIDDNFLFDGENIIISDHKGNIIVYSLSNKNIIFKYNFYKKRFKKIKKKLNLIINDNVIYISDNIGFLYALNYANGKLLWAKNYKIPFRSNIKIINNIIAVVDQNNSLYFIDKFNGNRTKLFPTEESTLKNEFQNTLSLKNDLFFLNTYGSLYSIDSKNYKINWFNNLNDSIDLNTGNLFFSNSLINYKNKIIISTDPSLYILDSKTGSIIFKKQITSIIRPIVSADHLFLITKDNLLVSIDLFSGKVVYSVDISQEIANFLNSKKKVINISNFFLTSNNLFIILNNSYFIKLNSTGQIQEINRLSKQKTTNPIFINNKMFYFNKSNKLIILN